MATAKSGHSAKRQDLLTLIVEEVDEAREVLELAEQLAGALPLHTFDDVLKAVGPSGNIQFRGNAKSVRNFAEFVPSLLFPIDTEQKLITLLYETVKRAPPWIRYNEADPANARRKLRRLGILGLSQGVLGRVGTSTQRVQPAVTRGTAAKKTGG